MSAAPTHRKGSMPKNGGPMRQPVSHHGTKPVIVPGARMKNTSDPSEAQKRRMVHPLGSRVSLPVTPYEPAPSQARHGTRPSLQVSHSCVICTPLGGEIIYARSVRWMPRLVLGLDDRESVQRRLSSSAFVNSTPSADLRRLSRRAIRPRDSPGWHGSTPCIVLVWGKAA